MTGPLQVTATVRALEQVEVYYRLVLEAPEVAVRARPGQFVALAVGGPASAMLLRRSFSIFAARPGDGTVEVVLAVAGRGTAWLAERRPGNTLDLVGPAGTPFRLPAPGSTAVLVGGGYGGAALFGLAAAVQEDGGRAELVLGAGTAGRVFGVDQALALGAPVTVTTEDGSAGTRGRVTDVLPGLLARSGAATVHACGPMAMLAAVARVAAAAGVPCQVAVEESMACGIGVCMTCVLPVRAADGQARMLRSCVEGPVFDAGRVRWDSLGRVPADAVGAGVR